MDVILHLGAHRTATTSFQAYLRAHSGDLKSMGLAFWGPRRTRNGLLADVANRPETPEAHQRAVGRLALNVENSSRQGASQLVISDENMIGSGRHCLRQRSLYPAIGERMARLYEALGGKAIIALQIRGLDQWWASVLTYLIPRGEAAPSPEVCAKLVDAPRSWRHVISDLACACPGAQIHVTPFECFCDAPDKLLRVMTGRQVVPVSTPNAFRVNARPDLEGVRAALEARGRDVSDPRLDPGQRRFNPFNDAQSMKLRDTYAEDLAWLRAGADGLATLTEDPELQQPARPWPRQP